MSETTSTIVPQDYDPEKDKGEFMNPVMLEYFRQALIQWRVGFIVKAVQIHACPHCAFEGTFEISGDCVGSICLKFYGVSTCIGGGLDNFASLIKITVMITGYFGNDVAWMILAYIAVTDCESVHDD